MTNENYKTGSAEFDENFEWLSGDCGWEDHGGHWYRKIGETRFQVVSIFNWEEAVGAREAEDIEGSHHVALYELDTNLEEQGKSAIASCGWDFEEDGSIGSPSGDIIADIKDEDLWRLVMCDAMSMAGARVEVGSWNGSDIVELFKKAAAESNRLAEDEEAFEAKMDEPGNGLGSTIGRAHV